MREYSVIIISLSVLDTLYGQHGESCRPNLQDDSLRQCEGYDPNLYCEASSNKCQCKEAYIKEPAEPTCQDARQIIRLDQSKAQTRLTTTIKRYADCDFLVVLDGRGRSQSTGETSTYTWYCALAPMDFEVNLARGKATWQSSTDGTAYSHRAVDGNEDPLFAMGSCSRTQSRHLQPWWAVDLGDVHAFHAISITNRGDCCSELLRDFNLGVSNRSVTEQAPRLTNYRICVNQSESLGPGESATFNCVETGRYVIIQSRANDPTALTLCEVKVLAERREVVESLARGKRAWQSSSSGAANAGRAVDGIMDTDFAMGSCSHTATEANPWWAVDLGQVYALRAVSVTNREDCCSDALSNFYVGVSNSSVTEVAPNLNNYRICVSQKTPLLEGETKSFPCVVAGRYVIVQSWVRTHLTLCEVDVLGVKPPEGCFGEGLELEGYSPSIPVYVIKSELLPCTPSTFYFRVREETGHTEHLLKFEATLRNEFRVHIEIACEKNCQAKVNPSRKLVLRAYCTNCMETSEQFVRQIKYAWNSLDSALNLSALMTPGTDSTLIIAEDKLNMSSNYTFFVTGGDQALAYIDVSTRSGLTVGTCEVTPMQGKVLVTQHTVICRGFAAPAAHRLHYSLRMKAGDGLGHLLHSSESNVQSNLTFPPGDQRNGWKLPLTITVCSIEKDPLCDTSDIGNVTVEIDDDLDVTELLDLLEGVADPQDAMQKALVLATILSNERGIETDGGPQERDGRIDGTGQVWEQVMTMMRNMSVDSFAKIQQQVSVLYEASKEVERLTHNSLISMAMQTIALTSRLIEFNTNAHRSSAESKETLETGKTLINVVSTLVTLISEVVHRKIKSINFNEVDIPPKLSTDHRDITQNLLTSLDSVSELLVRRKIAGEVPTVVKADDLIVTVKKIKPTHLRGLKVEIESEQGKKAARIELPHNFPLPNEETDLALGAMFFKTNPYVWSTTAREVTSPVAQVQLKRMEMDRVGRTLHPQNLTVPLRIIIPQEPVDIEAGNVTLESMVATSVVFNKTCDGSKAMILFDGWKGDLPMHAIINVTVYSVDMTAGNIDNTKDFRLSPNAIVVFNEMMVLGNEEKWVDLVVGSGSHIIDLKLMPGPEVTVRTKYTLYIAVAEIKCLYWDSDSEEWSDKGCHTGEESTSTELVCYCNHMTSFAGGFLPLPNKLHRTKIPFNALQQNPVGIAVVSAVVVIYCIALFFARKKDKADYIKGAVVDLADNDPTYHHVYIVTVQTGTRRHAGTTSHCCCVLIGLEGKSEPHVMFSPNQLMCQRGSIDSFVIRTKHSLGPVTRIRFWHDNTGEFPEWFISTCRVIDVSSGELYIFICNFWLADCVGENTIIKTFKAATESQQQDAEYLFFTNIIDAMEEMHIWFSPYSHQPDSHFTTVQRVSCCLSLFMTYMITNIMFYGIEPEKGEWRVNVGPTSVTWTELRIGMVSSAVVLPINVFLIHIFKSTRPRYARNLYHVHLDTLKKHLARSPSEYSDLQRRSTYSSIFSRRSSVSPAPYSHTQFLLAPAISLHQVSTQIYPHAMQSDESYPQLVSEHQERVRAAAMERRCLQACIHPTMPWWCIFINYALLLFIVGICGFFTIRYTLDYGYEKSLKWFCALLSSMFGDILINQPAKVLVITIVFTLIFKTTLTEPREILVNTKATDFGTHRREGDIDRLRDDMRSIYKPPDKTASRPDAYILKRQDDEKVHLLMFEILRYVIFLYLVMLVTYGRQNGDSFCINDFISQEVMNEEEMRACTTMHDIWTYVDEVLMDGLYDPQLEVYVSGIDSLRLVPPLLIQTRKLPCVAYHHGDQREGTLLFGVLKKTGVIGWRLDCTLKDEDNYGPEWEDQTQASSPVWEFNTTYQGYVAELGQTRAESKFKLDYLADTMWLDRYTTTLTIRVLLYNPTLNLMSHVHVKFHINNPAGVQVVKQIDSFKMYRSTRRWDVFLLLLEVDYVVFSLYFMFHVIRVIYREKRKYFKNVWSFLDLYVALMSLYVIGVYICQAYYTDQAVWAFQKYGDVGLFDTVLMLHHYMTYSLAVLVSCALLKFLHLLRFNPIVYRFLEVLRRARNFFVICILALFYIVFQFATLFHIIAAGRTEVFRTMTSSMSELFTSMLGKYEVEYLQEIHPFLAPLAFLIFLLIAVYISLSMMIAVLQEILRTIQKEALPDDEARLLALLIDRILQWFGIMRHEGARLSRHGLDRANLHRRRTKEASDSEELIIVVDERRYTK